MKISIVTPSFNSARYIRETIHSVISQQGDFFIEYIIVDGNSTDETKDVVGKVQGLLAANNYPLGCKGVDLVFISGQDEGMYDAINKGFARATGEVFAWLNADDIYLPGALATIARVFSAYEDVHWLKGITSYITEAASIWKAGNCLLYTRSWIKSGVYGRDHYFIQQDCVFWRSWLWEKTGGIDASFRRAGDYYLWIRFAELAPLVTVRTWLSCFRTVKGQLSEDVDAYRKEVNNLSPGSNAISRKIRLFHRFEGRLPGFLRATLFRMIFGQQEFSVILIRKDGSLNRITGNYYEVLSLL